MSALAAAHELPLGGRELAMLCQKAEVRLQPIAVCAGAIAPGACMCACVPPELQAELQALSCTCCCCGQNLVVGAPCGVMDQLTASLGDEGQLLALLCQPAEVLGCVPIPPQVCNAQLRALTCAAAQGGLLLAGHVLQRAGKHAGQGRARTHAALTP